MIYDSLAKEGSIPNNNVYRAEFIDTLSNNSVLSLVGEIDSVIVATASVHYEQEKSLVFYSYGLVHPLFKNKGIGTQLFTVRLSLIKLQPGIPSYIYLLATDRSKAYYQDKFSFEYHGEDIDEYNNKSIGLKLLITNQHIQTAKKYIEETKILKTTNLEIPDKQNDLS